MVTFEERLLEVIADFNWKEAAFLLTDLQRAQEDGYKPTDEEVNLSIKVSELLDELKEKEA